MYLHDCIPDYQFGVCLTNYRIIYFQVNVSWLLLCSYIRFDVVFNAVRHVM